MSNYGITATGFSRKTYVDLVAEMEENLKSQDAFGDGIDFSPQDPLYQLSVPYLYMLSELWELAEQVFYSASPKFSEGNNLSNTGKYIGIGRKQATKATGTIRIYGIAGTAINKGFRVATDNLIVFQTVTNASIQSSGYVDIQIVAEVAGISGNTPENTITTIINPAIGISSVSNLTATEKGQDIETDISFRERYDTSTSISSGSTLDAIRSNVLVVTGVNDVIIKGNESDIEMNGIPPHSFETFVYGGENASIAQAIFNKKPGGIRAHGSVNVDVVDSQGEITTIGFSRPTNVEVWFKISKTVNESYPADGDTRVINAILNYVKSIKLGEDIILYKIISLISNLNLSGLLDIGVQLSLDGINYTSSNASIEYNAIAITNMANIEVL